MSEIARIAEQGSLLAFLVGSMLAMGLICPLRSVVPPMRNTVLILTALGLNFILAPVLARLIIVVIPLDAGHSAGLLLLGGAAGAPFLPKLVQTARGDPALGLGLMILLTLGTIVFLPFVLPRMIPGFTAHPWKIARPLVLFIMLPLAAGMVIRGISPSLAERVAPAFAGIGNVGLLAFSALLVALNFPALVGVIGSGAIAAATVYLTSLFLAAWWLGGKDPRTRSVLALATTARNFGAAFAPATNSFGDPKVTTMLVVCAVVCLAASFAAARWVRRRA